MRQEADRSERQKRQYSSCTRVPDCLVLMPTRGATFSADLLPQQFSCETCGLICEKTLPGFLVSVENLTTFFVDLWMGALENLS